MDFLDDHTDWLLRPTENILNGLGADVVRNLELGPQEVCFIVVNFSFADHSCSKKRGKVIDEERIDECIPEASGN